MNCPECNALVLAENINVATDVGKCQNCELVFVVSENLVKKSIFGFNLDKPTDGTWVKYESNYVLVGANTRSWQILFIVPFSLFWTFGISHMFISIFTSGSISLVEILVCIPFLAATLIIIGVAIMQMFGKVEVIMDNQKGEIFTGVLQLGYRQYFNWNEIESINDVEVEYRFTGSGGGKLFFAGKRRIPFAFLVEEDKRYYMYRFIKSILFKIKSGKNIIQYDINT